MYLCVVGHTNEIFHVFDSLSSWAILFTETDICQTMYTYFLGYIQLVLHVFIEGLQVFASLLQTLFLLEQHQAVLGGLDFVAAGLVQFPGQPLHFGFQPFQLALHCFNCFGRAASRRWRLTYAAKLPVREQLSFFEDDSHLALPSVAVNCQPPTASAGAVSSEKLADNRWKQWGFWGRPLEILCSTRYVLWFPCWTAYHTTKVPRLASLVYYI